MASPTSTSSRVCRRLSRHQRRPPAPQTTVGTVTEIHDYLRLRWARIAIRLHQRRYAPVSPTHSRRRQSSNSRTDALEVLEPAWRKEGGTKPLKDLAALASPAPGSTATSAVDEDIRTIVFPAQNQVWWIAGPQGGDPAASHRVPRAGLRLAEVWPRSRSSTVPRSRSSRPWPVRSTVLFADCNPATSLQQPYGAARCSGIGTATRSTRVVIPDPDRSIRSATPLVEHDADYHKRLPRALATEISSDDTPSTALEKVAR